MSIGITPFPLHIKLDQDGIEFTHFKGGIGHILTPGELPIPLWKRLDPFVTRLFDGEILSLELNPKGLPRFCMNPEKLFLLEDLSDETEEILTLTAWWMERSYRIRAARGKDGWKCVECEKHISPPEEWCEADGCLSRKILQKITGESRPSRNNLRLVAPIKLVKKTGTHHR